MARAKTMQQRRLAIRAADTGDRVVASNRRARHEFDILETIECGMVLSGSEVKSLREGRAQIADAYARVEDGELWVFGVHIPPWTYAVGFGSHDPNRRRKLLVHAQQIDDLRRQTERQPLTLVPLRIAFRQGRAKLDLAVARGRKMQDRRRVLAERDAEREMQRAHKQSEQRRDD
jgi:SsrA-binding protein